MNKKYHKYYLFIILLLWLPFVVEGQQGIEIPKAERLELFTDRGLYIAGENIHFAAFVANHARPGLSDIVYAEIIEPDGTQIAGGKFRLIHGSSHGCLTIPSHIFTGNYYLRVYTKYMRNLGPRSFAYVRLKIVNPYKKEVLKGKRKLRNVSRKISGKSPGGGIKIVTGKRTYLTREKANVTLKSDGIHPDKIQRLCVAVIPELAAPYPDIPTHPLSAKVNIINFYPENRGLSITGTLQDSLTKKREAGVDIDLSIIGKGKIFMVAKTDRSGHFFFSLPYYTGNRDLFLEPQNIHKTHPKILVNNDFSVAPIQLPNPLFKMDSSERSAAFQMAQNFWVKQLFYNGSSHSCSKKDSASVNAFYGKPYYTLKLDQYIQLPTLLAYFENVSPLVKIRKRQGKRYLKIISELPEMNFLPPLVLVDGVAIDATEKILAASPRDLSRIEVITVPYVIGNILYGGVINIITKRGDFAGIDLPRSGMFLNYRFLHNNCHCAIITPDSIGEPDTRNTLYWDPEVSMDPGKEIRFSFTTADTPGKYAIVLQGIGSDGKPFMEKDTIVVKSKN